MPPSQHHTASIGNFAETTILAFLIVAGLAIVFDAVLASTGMAAHWPVRYTAPGVLAVATLATSVISTLAGY